MTDEEMQRVLALPSTRYRNDYVLIDVKFEPNSYHGWMIWGNDWSRPSPMLITPVTRYELINKGWLPYEG